MKRKNKLYKLISLFILLIIFGFSSTLVKASESLKITKAVTLNNNIEYLEKDVSNKKYSGFKDNVIRVYYESSLPNSITLSYSDYYLDIIEDYKSENLNYLDILLKERGEIVLLFEIIDEETSETIVYDHLDITIYDEVFDISLSTITNSAFIDKRIAIDVIINNDENLFLPEIYFYYVDSVGRNIIINEVVNRNNKLILNIDNVMALNKEITIHAKFEEVLSNDLKIEINEVSYVTYFDLVRDNLIYTISDEIGSFYVRIPLNSTPDFLLLDESNSINLINYNIVRNYDTYNLVEVNLNLLKECENTQILIGGLMDETNNYIYKQINLSIISVINKIEIKETKIDLEYGEIANFTLLINDLEGVINKANWYVNDELVWTGETLNYQFYDSGYQNIRVEYQGFVDETRVYVGYSDSATSVWYILFFALIILGVPVLFFMMKRNRNRVTILKKDFIVISNNLKGLSYGENFHHDKTSLKNMLLRCIELAEEIDNTFLDNVISELKKIQLWLNALQNISEDKFDDLNKKIQERIKITLDIFELAERLERKNIKEKGGKKDD